MASALIENYRSHPGDHCGSVAMRGLLEHYCGLELPEPAVFGLGSGLDCIYLSSADMDPACVTFGRTITMEVDVASALEVDYREQTEEDDARAWDVVRKEVAAGRPTMLSGDIFYLDYREYKVHFPGHRFVLLGFDDDGERAHIADRIRPEPEVCSYGALIRSRNPPEGISTHNLWGRFHGTELGRDLRSAAGFAIDRCARRMLGEEAAGADPSGPIAANARVVSGIAGIEELARAVPSWAARDDAGWLATYNARCIEKFGNGGGNFRRLYGSFLEWARALDPGRVPETAPELARRAADQWTAVSEALMAAADRPELFEEAARRTAAIASTERELFSRLLDGAA